MLINFFAKISNRNLLLKFFIEIMICLYSNSYKLKMSKRKIEIMLVETTNLKSYNNCIYIINY